MILAIDPGTTGTMCLVMGGTGEVVVGPAGELTQPHRRPGWGHDPAGIWQLTHPIPPGSGSSPIGSRREAHDQAAPAGRMPASATPSRSASRPNASTGPSAPLRLTPVAAAVRAAQAMIPAVRV